MAFQGKVALVTGAGSGMGRLLTKRLVAGGARVAALDMNEAGLKETAEGAPDQITPFKCDVTDLARLEEIVETVERDIGPLDRVAHLAAIMPSKLLADENPDDVMRLMRINYGGTVNVVTATLGRMVKRGRGELILFGSLAGMLPAPHFGAYAASKAAVNIYGEILHHEVRKSGVKVLTVCPPAVDTPLIAQATSKPKTLSMALDRKMLVKPEQVLDEVEKAIAKGQPVVYPTAPAKIQSVMRRLTPGMLWKTITKIEEM
ncbi:MAG: SDR family oxidoreductase [Myxococcales bacterium]|nr:SDR family oxidoreductase [Myxococcales bacterium]